MLHINIKGFFWIFESYFIFSYSRFLLVIHFIHISVYMSIPISQFITPPPPPPTFPPWCPYVCSLQLCLYFCPANQFICTIFLGSTYVLIYDICFSLSNLLRSVWQSLDSSMSLQMTQFCSFLRRSSIPFYICTTFSLSIHLLLGI